MSVRIIVGDCLDAMPALAADSIDSIVTDPPYGLGFMGKDWDHGVPGEHFWREVLRIAKPGAHLLAFGGTRTFHRLMVAIENAGWEIRDTIMWVYGSGFPKSLDVSKTIDKSVGEFRPRIAGGVGSCNTEALGRFKPGEAISGEAIKWNGWGTALKPAWEPIIVARKPLAGSVAANVLQFGAGALNIDASRIPANGEQWDGGGPTMARETGIGFASSSSSSSHDFGRWPANLIHDGSDEVVALFPAEAGAFAPVRGTEPSQPAKNTYGEYASGGGAFHGDIGSAARFFKSAEWEDSEWLDVFLSLAPIADGCFCLQSLLDAIARSDAATSALPAGIRLNACRAPSTTAMARESRRLAESVITAISNIGPKCLRVWQHERLSPSDSLVQVVATREPIGTMTITASLWRSDGCVEPVTFSITPANSGHGVAAFAPRFIYCSKADREDRDVGCEGMPPQSVHGPSGDNRVWDIPGSRSTHRANNHPTVKPAELMAYLVRLVTPPGGTVLDPFAGSGSTGLAADRLQFNAVLIELDPAYAAIAEQRILGDAPLFAEIA